MSVSKILITGASGFVGKTLIQVLASESKYEIHTIGRQKTLANSQAFQIKHHAIDFSQKIDLDVLNQVNVVIHCAARVHVINETSLDPLADFRQVNVQGTLNIARQAVEAGVKRFIFISSIKVNGEGTSPDQPYCADDLPKPTDPYGVSKLEAEVGLLALAKETGLEVVIIRPVLVYGPGVKANFQSMMKWLYKGVPLPLGAIHNKRSLVALDNLVDLISVCIEHPAATNQVFLVSDDDDLSTTELFRKTSIALGRVARLIPVPSILLIAFAKIMGKSEFSKRLCGSLQVDITKTKKLLGWLPPKTVDESLQKTADFFMRQKV